MPICCACSLSWRKCRYAYSALFMQPISIAASPLTYAEYRKLSFADFRTRYPLYYIGLPAFTIFLLLVIVAMVANAAIATLAWQNFRATILMFGAVVLIWVGTWYSLRQNYRKNSVIRNGAAYYLTAQEITQKGEFSEVVLWSNIARTAVQSGRWILLRQASPTSKEVYFLNTAGVLPPATRAELLVLLKSKGIKRI